MKLFRLLSLVVIAGILFGGFGWNEGLAQEEQPADPTQGVVNPGVPLEFKLQLPLIHRSYPADSIFGVEMNDEMANPNVGAPAYLLSKAGATWTRYQSLYWGDVEPTPGARLWDPLVDNAMLSARKNNLNPILIIWKTPSWAQKIPGFACGPIKLDKMDEFANFMRDVVSRYSGPPYYVKYFELWNEPDVETYDPNWPYQFGCWGNSADQYFGGGYYAEMLKQVYPAIKAANPWVQVLVGGLLMGCDPVNPPYIPGTQNRKDCKSSRFLEGILANGGGNYFDGVSFHAYDLFPGASEIVKTDPNSGLGNYSNFNWWSAWNTTGPLVIAKANYLRSVLNQYGFGNKYLINTEIAVICGDDVSIDDHCDSYYPTTSLSFQNTKAYFAVQAYVAARWLNLRANIWYSYFGWRDSGFFNTHANKQEAVYNAFSFTRQKINWASAVNVITAYPNVKGYEFIRPGGKVWVLWYVGGDPKNGALTTPVSLPSIPKAVYYWVKVGSGTINDGTYQLGAASKSLTIGRGPVFVEFP